MSDLSFLLADCASDADSKDKIEIIEKIFEIVGRSHWKRLLEETDANDNSVFHLAALNGFSRIFKILHGKLRQLLDVDLSIHLMGMQNKRGFTPLQEVCFRGYKRKKDKAKCDRGAIIEACLDLGADVNIQNEETKMRPLHWAAYNGDRSAIKALLKKRPQQQADYRAFSYDGQLPIDFAASSQAYDCVDTFLDHFKKEKGYAGG